MRKSVWAPISSIVAQFGCEWAYTMDGGEVGELEFENFNAASAKISFKGRNVHPAMPRIR